MDWSLGLLILVYSALIYALGYRMGRRSRDAR